MNDNNGQIRVLVADDHAVFCRGLVYAFDVQPDIIVVGEAHDGYDAVQKTRDLKPDLVLMDLLMPRCGGIEAMMTIKRIQPSVKVIILTASDRKEHLFEAISMGASGVLTKDSPVYEIVTAVHRAYQGRIVLSPRFTAQLVGELREEDSQPALSEREIEVLRMVGQGYNNKDIAECLMISESSVGTYVSRCMEKLNLRNRHQVMVYAIQHNLKNKSNGKTDRIRFPSSTTLT